MRLNFIKVVADQWTFEPEQEVEIEKGKSSRILILEGDINYFSLLMGCFARLLCEL